MAKAKLEQVWEQEATRGKTRQKDRRGGESSKAEGQEKDGQTGLERKGQERK